MICWLLVIVYSTRSEALPGNAYSEAVPPIFPRNKRGKPLEIGSQAEPWNQLNVHWYYPKNL